MSSTLVGFAQTGTTEAFMLTTHSVREFLDETASHSPAPGGGSVAALAASLGTALTSMVCQLTIGKKKYADVQPEMERILAHSEELRIRATSIIDEDTVAFNKVMTAFAMPKDSDAQKAFRAVAIQQATKEAALVPMRLMELCADAMPMAKAIAEKGNQNSLSDAGVAALMFSAACEGAALNVKINLSSLDDKTFVQQALVKVNYVLTSVQNASRETLTRIHGSFVRQA